MRVSSRIRNDLPGALLHARVAVRVVALHFSESCLANPRMPVRVSLRYCVPIKRPDNVSEWHLMKNLEAIEASNVVACANLRSREIGLRGPEPIKSVFDHSDFPIDEDEDGDLRWYKRKDGWTRDEYWDVYWHESGGYPATISYLSAKAASKVLNDAEHGISLLLVTGGQYCYNSGKHEIREFFRTWNRKEDPPLGQLSMMMTLPLKETTQSIGPISVVATSTHLPCLRLCPKASRKTWRFCARHLVWRWKPSLRGA